MATDYLISEAKNTICVLNSTVFYPDQIFTEMVESINTQETDSASIKCYEIMKIPKHINL